MLRYPGSMPLRPAVCLAAFAAAALAFATPALPLAPAPCVATGVLALLAPGQAVPTVVGPTIAAADREATTDDAVVDPATGLKVAHTQLGVAGCVGSGAPGGTSAHADALSVLGGAVRADTLDADLVPADGSGSGWRLRARHDGLDVPVGQDVPVGNWGFLQAQVTVDAGAGEPLRWWRAALALRLVRTHAGLAAGTTLLIGWVSANARPGPPPAPAPKPKPAPAPKPKAKPKPKPKPPVTTTTTTTTATTTTTKAPAPKAKPKQKPKPKPKKPRGWHPSHDPLRATPPLAAGRYVFPVAGRVAWGDTYGGERSDVPGGWHHGDDLFADLGTPVVAVTDGTVFAVGWNRVGGWRLWLRDDDGDAFYYAHFAGYTALAHNNNRVRRGDVLGFVGNTGDAFTTEPHLHFEVHPNALLPLGYDGAVDPTTYLASWSRIDRLKAPPPVELPSRAGHGHGAVSDFRRLLAIRPLEKPAKAAPQPEQPAVRRQAAPLRTASLSRSHRDGWGAIAAAIVLVGGALVAVATAARSGRSR
jgi:hypothetical protein